MRSLRRVVTPKSGKRISVKRNVVRRVAAEASLADPEQALERARSTGDDRDVEGLLPLQFRVSVDATGSDGKDFIVDRVNEDVWVEVPGHPPQLEEAVREIASKDFGELAKDLRERGVNVSGDDLGDMYVTVTLEDPLRDVVLERSARTTA
jgi:hypothetical protein